MDYDVKKEARRQYLHYFRFWLIGAGIVLLLAIGAYAIRSIGRNASRTNTNVSDERVYDYADVLTDDEEESLRKLIAKLEKKCQADIVLVTINEAVGSDDYTWEQTMMKTADDLFEDAQNNYAQPYGWNKPYGDGALLLDNWYEDENGSQKGSWLSTSGRMERLIGSSEESRVFDAMDNYIDGDPYRAYKAALDRLADYGAVSSGSSLGAEGVLGSFAIATVAALIYAVVCLKNAKAKDTTTAATYVLNGRPVVRVREDRFIRKDVVRRHIERDHSGGGGGGSHHSGGGSYGHHSSSSGHSHGGGGRRR